MKMKLMLLISALESLPTRNAVRFLSLMIAWGAQFNCPVFLLDVRMNANTVTIAEVRDSQLAETSWLHSS